MGRPGPHDRQSSVNEVEPEPDTGGTATITSFEPRLGDGCANAHRPEARTAERRSRGLSPDTELHGIEFAPDRFERMDVSVLALTFVEASEGNAAGSEPSPGATS
jgi:hypothetical protein